MYSFVEKVFDHQISANATCSETKYTNDSPPPHRKAAPSSYTPGHTFTPESPMLLISGGLSECFNVAGGCDDSHTTSTGSGESSSLPASETMLAAAVVEANAFIEGMVAVVESQAAAAKASTPASSGQQQQHLTMRGPFLARVSQQGGTCAWNMPSLCFFCLKTAVVGTVSACVVTQAKGPTSVSRVGLCRGLPGLVALKNKSVQHTADDHP